MGFMYVKRPKEVCRHGLENKINLPDGFVYSRSQCNVPVTLAAHFSLPTNPVLILFDLYTKCIW